MILDGLLTILQTLFGWLFLVITQMLLRIVDIIETFFDIFAGTEPVYYKGEPAYLFNMFFSNKAITNLFWAMAIIAIVIAFGLCIVAVARKVTDVAGTTKHTLGQIISNFIRSMVVILLLNLCIVAALNVTTVIFDRINFSMENADSLHMAQEKRYTNEEFATMTRIMATMGNYAANPSSESRYNVNSCFNAIRGEMLTLFEAGCFDYDFTATKTGKHTWQSALAQVAKAANLKEDLQLDTYYPAVQEAIGLCFDELKTNIHFKPQETAVLAKNTSESLSTAKLIFLVSSMGAEENEQFRSGSFDDALRRSYINGEKNFLSFSDVNEDFAITEINYLIALLVTLACIFFMGKIVLTFIVRMLNLILLYVVSPLFASSMSLDEGSRFQNWTQTFVMQLLAAYASVVMMRIYLFVIPIVVNNDLKFFPIDSVMYDYNIYGQLIFVLAGAWAVSKATSLITGALTGNAGAAVQEADSYFGHLISDAVGTERLYKELERGRNRSIRNKDKKRDRDERKKDAEESRTKTMNELKDVIGGNRDKGRTNTTADKKNHDDSESTLGNAGLDRMRENAGLTRDSDDSGDKSKNMFDKLNDSEVSRSSSSINKLREQMGFSSPSAYAVNDAPESFDIDSLPDLGKGRGATGNTGTKGDTGKTGAAGKSGLNSKSAPSRTRNTGGIKPKSVQQRADMKAKIKKRLSEK